MLGIYARNLREYLELSPKEVAKLAKVSSQAVDLLEREQPVQLDEKRRIIAALYQKKASRFA
ncbi:hypothetical protein ACFLVB_00410 [Chloroflexota bacterium]